MAIEIVDVDQQAVVRLAHRAAISTYDAGYLWLARHFGGERVTLHQKLRKVALAIGTLDDLAT